MKITTLPTNCIYRLLGRSVLLLVSLLIAYFAISPMAQAVVPPPDGGYANFTTAEGTNALLHLTSRGANTGLGWSSLLNVTTGSFNTGIGAGTLALNNGDQNTATGAGALLSDTTGTGNTANAAFALFSNNTGSFNTAIGYQALFNNTTGTGNIALGASAGGQITIGSDNIDIGNPGGPESSAIRIGLNQTKAFIAGHQRRTSYRHSSYGRRQRSTWRGTLLQAF
jgi:hypothetical protein